MRYRCVWWCFDEKKFDDGGKAIKTVLLAAAVIVGLSLTTPSAQAQIPLVDAHIHYNHDVWNLLSPAEAIKILRKAGLKKAFVSSSNDDGTQMLYEIAPDLVVPVLRPYRRRGEISSWYHDETIVGMVEERLAKNHYAGIGELHVYGPNADRPVVRRIVELAAKYKIFLHAHSDIDAVERIFAQNPEARVLWAHSGFDSPEDVAMMLRKYKNLWTELAFRSEHAFNGKLDPQWRKVFLEFPDRFMIGTDTYTMERWYYVLKHAYWSRGWIADLPRDVGDNIAYRNAEALAKWALQR